MKRAIYLAQSHDCAANLAGEAYLMGLDYDHTSPFEQVNFTFHIKMPIFVARQWIRHRTARVNEISGRYSVMNSEHYLPAREQINMQSEDNKQGRASEAVSDEVAEKVLKILSDDQKRVYESYEQLLEMGIARELSRINLPLSLYTEWYWQMDLHNLFHFLRLRLDEHAQYEIRAYAQVILDIIRLAQDPPHRDGPHLGDEEGDRIEGDRSLPSGCEGEGDPLGGTRCYGRLPLHPVDDTGGKAVTL